MRSDDSCIFCKIVQSKIPASIVLQNKAAVAFLDINPIATGHLLVIPVEHCSTLTDIAPEAMARLAGELPRLSQVVLEASGAVALNLICNSGKEAGQEVPHLHFHLIPRYTDDQRILRTNRMGSDDESRERMCQKMIDVLVREGSD